MVKCLITKLKGVTDNGSLLKIGELPFHLSVGKQPTQYNRKICILSGAGAEARVTNGYFTNNNFSGNIGSVSKVTANVLSRLIMANTDCNIFIGDKYSLLKIDLENWDGSNIVDSDVEFDISNLSFCKKIKVISAPQSKFYGDISNLKDLNDIQSINLSSTNVTGDISVFARKSNLKSLGFDSTKVGGNIETLSDCPLLEAMSLGYDVAITGDASRMPGKFRNLTAGNLANLTWKNSRNASYPIISFISATGINFGEDLDAMLINQATCAIPNSGAKTIAVIGKKTSASDAAIATLQQKGYTVSITPA